MKKGSRYLRGNEESSNGSDSSDTEGERSSAGSTSVAWWRNIGWGGCVVGWWAVITRARSRLGVFWDWLVGLGLDWVFMNIGLSIDRVFMSVSLGLDWVFMNISLSIDRIFMNVCLGWAPGGSDGSGIAVVLSRADSGVDGGGIDWLFSLNWVFNWVLSWGWFIWIWSRIRVVAWWDVVGWGVIFFRNIGVGWLSIDTTASRGRVDSRGVDLGWAILDVVTAVSHGGVLVLGVGDWGLIWGESLLGVDLRCWSVVDWRWLLGWLVLACLDGSVDLGLVTLDRGVVDWGFVIFTSFAVTFTCQSSSSEEGRSGDDGREMHCDYITNIVSLRKKLSSCD